jgi:hypothetical protein
VLAAVKNKPAVATAAPRDDEGFIQAGAKERSRPNKMMGRNGSVDSYGANDRTHVVLAQYCT